MKCHWTLASRVWLGCLVVSAVLLATPARAATCPTPLAKINPDSLSIPDFTPLAGGGWVVNTVDINGQSSQPNANQGGQFQWSFVGPAQGTLAGANNAKVQFTAPDVTVSTQVVLRLTVTVSGCPGSDSEDIPVTITNAHDIVINAPPHAVPAASPASASEGTLVTLDGSASWDPDSSNLTYAWLQTGGPPITLSATANPANRTFVAPNFSADTLLTFQLTVSDGSLVHSDVTYVNVTWRNDPPVAALACPADGFFDVDEGDSFTLDGSASSDGDDGIASYEWQQEVGLPEVPDVGNWNTSQVTFNVPSLGYGQDGLVPFTLTVTDHGGAKSTASCALFIHDITVPVITTPLAVTAEATSAAGANVGVLEGYVVSAFDAVDGNLPLVNYSEYFVCEPAPGALFALDATTPVLCGAWDSAGNAASASFPVSVIDTTGPDIKVPLSFAVEATGPDGAPAEYAVKSNDAVDGERDATCVPASGSVFPINAPGPTTTITCSAIDAHDNAGEPRAFTVAVHDTTSPAFDPDSISPDLIAEATSASGAQVDFALPTASDLVDLDEVTVACLPAPGSMFPLGATAVTCDAVDTRGNSTVDDEENVSATFQVTVEDTTPPSLSDMPANQMLEALSAAGTPFAYLLPAAVDAVDGTRPVSCSNAPETESPGMFPLGATTVTCVASDTRGNTASAFFTVTVIDTTAPEVTPPSNVTAEATGVLTTVAHGTATATDAVGVASLTSDAPAAFPLGTTTITWTATDAAGNSGTATSTVTVVDTTAPSVTPPSNVTAEATGVFTTVAHGTATATDAVGVVSLTSNAPATFPLGTTTITWTAMDAAGNSGTATSTVTVVDTTAPAISAHNDVTAIAAANSAAIVSYTVPTAVDLVDGVVPVTCTPASDSSFTMGSTTVTCSAQDSRGNRATRTFAVVVTYNFTGFFQPIDNSPALNAAKAGSAIPVKFSLGGNQGMNIFQSNPASGVIACGATEGDAIEETLTAGSSNLQFDPGSNQYIYVWKTEKSWAGQCRILQIRFKDGSSRSALFKFK